MRQHFRVRSAAKRMSAFFELGAQLAIVVDLAVEDDGDDLSSLKTGCSPGDEIDDREPSHAERDAGRHKQPSESGPRWTIRSHIACSSSRAPSGGGV